jgi:hypothetical protein
MLDERYETFLPLLSSFVLRNCTLFWISMHINVVDSWLNLHLRAVKQNVEIIGNAASTSGMTVPKACV